MKFFVEKNEDAGHRVTINIPKITVNNAVYSEFIKIRKKTNINGFRKGKIPIKVVQEKYGDSIYYDVFKQLMQKFFYKFLEKEKIKIIGTPKYCIYKKEDEKKEYCKYSVIYELYPTFQLKDIKFIKVKKITVKITDSDIKKNIERHMSQVNSWKTVNRGIKVHDRVTINYSIYEKNKKIDKFDSENVKFIVSENTFLPELNNHIINHVINDIIFFKIKFHSLYPEQELQDKDISFKIKIIKIEKKQELELEKSVINNPKKEEIFTKLNYQNIKNNLNAQIKNINQKYLEDQIIHEIIKKNSILIPPILFQEEIKIIYKQYKKQYTENKHNILEKKYHVSFELIAKKRLYFRIIIEKIITDHQLFIDENSAQALIKKISLNYKNPKEIITLYNNNNNLKNTIKKIELKNQAMHFLEKNITVVKDYWTFDKFINYNWKNYEELFI